MSKLVDLVNYRFTLLKALNGLRMDEIIDLNKHTIASWSKHNPVGKEYQGHISELSEIYVKIQELDSSAIKKISELISTVECDIDNCISALPNKSVNDDYLYNAYQIELSESIFSIVNTTVGDYCSWKYPALSLHPASTAWVNLLVANDPLYIVHPNIEFAQDIIKDYSEIYKNRLRLYASTDDLPVGQFGFILAWGTFNHYPLTKIKDNLERLFHLLRPGGVLMFNYNNCDFEGSALLAEAGLAEYANYRFVKQHVLDAGYEIISSTDLPATDAYNPYISWIEIRKPGTLTTVKAHQALAKIIE